MNLSQQELRILVSILTQVTLPYKDYDLVKPLVEKLQAQIVQSPAQDVKVEVKEEPSQPQS